MKLKAKSHKREAKFRFGEYIHSFSIVVMKHRDQGLLEKRELCVLMVPEGGKPVRELRQQAAGTSEEQLRVHVSDHRQEAKRVNWDGKRLLKAKNQPCSDRLLQQGHTS